MIQINKKGRNDNSFYLCSGKIRADERRKFDFVKKIRLKTKVTKLRPIIEGEVESVGVSCRPIAFVRRDRCMVSLNFVPLSGFFEDRPFATTHRPSPVPGLVQFLNGRLCRFFRSARLVDRPGAYQNFKPISQPIVPPRNWISSLSSNPFVSIVKELSFLSLFCFFGTLSSSWKNKDKGRREERGREYLLEKLF